MVYCGRLQYEVRRSPRKRKHELFETSPTKEGLTEADMDGSRSSHAMWARESPFSISKYNTKKGA